MKKIRKSRYEYLQLEVGERQYDDIDLSEELIVEARYIKFAVSSDAGNKYIEALPRPRNEMEILRSYEKTLNYNMEQEMEIPSDERKYHVGQLRQLRFPLPFHKELEFSLYNALVNSYRDRYQMMDADIPLTVTIADKEIQVCGKLLGDSASSANAGFALLGCSGCGKSSALKILLSNYPQVIMHHDSECGRQPQIVYLVVNCVPNSNFSALYAGIGDAIDKALGITNGCYEKMISSKRNLGAKAEKVRELVEKFAIGIIIFDEIQLIDFTSTKENSFESLMTLTNRTKVAIAVVGTEDAYAKMFVHLRTARRIGNVIMGNNYCENKAFFSVLVKKLFSYQWFDTAVAISQELIDVLYENTHGIADQLIGLYMYMNIDYLSVKKRPTVDSQFVTKVADKYYGGIRALLATYQNPISEIERREKTKMADIKLQELLEISSQNAFAEKISRNEIEHGMEIRVQKKNVIQNIQMVTADYSVESIGQCLDKVMNLSTSEGASEQEISRMVLQRLQSKSKDSCPRKVKAKAIDHSVMAKYVME